VQVVNKAPKANQAPVVNAMEAVTLQAGETYALHAQAVDPDGDALTFLERSSRYACDRY
jgi:chitinase